MSGQELSLRAIEYIKKLFGSYARAFDPGHDILSTRISGWMHPNREYHAAEIGNTISTFGIGFERQDGIGI